MQKIYFTADLHLDHNNLIKRGIRPQFNNCKDHDKTILDNWNSTVNKCDIVYILGDCVWDQNFEVLKNFNGQKVIIKGNHDRVDALNRAKSNNIINNWHYMKGLTYKGEFIYMCHFPMLSWERSFYDSYLAFGHCHGSQKITCGRSMDVGVDLNNFTPILVDNFIDKLKDRSNKYLYEGNNIIH